MTRRPHQTRPPPLFLTRPSATTASSARGSRPGGASRPPGGAQAHTRRVGLTHIAIAAAALLACAPDAESITTIRSICVDDTTLQVQLAGCHSTECLQLESSTCTATQAGDEVRVEAEAVLTRRPYRTCDGPCRSVLARCSLPEAATDASTLWVDGVEGPALREAGCEVGVIEFGSAAD